MKELKRVLMLLILGTVFSSLKSTGATLSQPGLSVSFQTFYDELAPYGQWITYQDHGRVWVPEVEEGFQPYGTRGHWVVTEYGNTWVSDYDWGWAPFHYGRWLFDDYYGWIWVPGSEWGPAWVNWRSGGGYYGWAPLGPGIDINININIPLSRWIFVPQRYITHRSVYNYHVPRNRYQSFYGHTTVINNIYVRDNRRYFAGPRRSEMERVTRGRIPVRQVHVSDRPGRTVADRGSVRVYRPEVTGRNNTPGRPAADRPSRDNSTRYTSTERPRRSGSEGGVERSYPSAPRSEVNRRSPNNGDRNTARSEDAGRTSWPSRPSRAPQTVNTPSETRPDAGNSNRNMENRARRSSDMNRSEGRTERATPRPQPQTRQRSEAPQRSAPRMQRAPQSRPQPAERSAGSRGSSSGERPSRGANRLTAG